MTPSFSWHTAATVTIVDPEVSQVKWTAPLQQLSKLWDVCVPALRPSPAEPQNVEEEEPTAAITPLLRPWIISSRFIQVVSLQSDPVLRRCASCIFIKQSNQISSSIRYTGPMVSRDMQVNKYSRTYFYF